jgi:hypothetical protein
VLILTPICHVNDVCAVFLPRASSRLNYRVLDSPDYSAGSGKVGILKPRLGSPNSIFADAIGAPRNGLITRTAAIGHDGFQALCRLAFYSGHLAGLRFGDSVTAR